MKKLWIMCALLTACTGPGQDQQAYNRVVGKAVENPESAECYYETSGCTAKELSAKSALSSSYNGRDAVPYPRDGYVLGGDGLYHFDPLQFERRAEGR